jgi:hypothetical protein
MRKGCVWAVVSLVDAEHPLLDSLTACFPPECRFHSDRQYAAFDIFKQLRILG